MADQNQTDAFIKEVEEDLRREQIQKLWERYGTYVLVVAAAIVIGVYLYKSQEQQRMEQTALAGDVYSQASQLYELGKHDDAMKTFRLLAKESPPGYATLAQFRIIADAVQKGQFAAAVKEYDRLATELTDPILAGFARLQGALLRVDFTGFPEIENRLRSLTEPGAPWRHPAIELLAVSAYKAGRLATARREFEKLIVDRQTPAAIRDRAQTFLTLIAQGEGPPEPPAKSGGGQGPQQGAPAAPPAAPPAPAPPKAEPGKGGKAKN